jgi:hypothetical protein
MSPVHKIRLKGPWNYQWLASDPPDQDIPDPATGRVHVPVTWQECFGARTGLVRWTRRFQRPRFLDPDERVLLGLDGLVGIERVCLNHDELALRDVGLPERKYDLTDWLLPSNQLEIEMRHAPGDDPLRGGLAVPAVLHIASFPIT